MIKVLCAIAVILSLAAALPAGYAAGEADQSLTLAEAVQLALARDALVRHAQQSLDNAGAALVQASALTPTLSTSAGTSASSSAGLDPESAISGTESSSQYYSSSVQVPLRGTTRLDLSTSAFTSTTNSDLRAGGGMTYTYAGASVGAGVSHPLGLFRDERVLAEGGRWSAQLGVRGAELALEEARRQVVSDTLTLFFAALRAQQSADIAAASKREADELLRIAQAQFDRGRVAEIEVMEAQVSADSSGVGLRTAQSSAASALDTLKNFLGLPVGQDLQVSYADTPDASLAPPDGPSLIERALAQRTDLQQLALSIQSAELSVRQVEAQSRPSAYLSGGYSLSGQGPTVSESLHQLDNPSWYVGLSLSTDLMGRENRVAIEQARNHLRLARVEEELQQDEVRLEIRQLVREVENAAANAELLVETVRMAEENLRIRQVQFQHGLIRPTDVVQTEHQLTDTRTQRLNAVIDHRLARARLSLAMGEMPALAGIEESPAMNAME